MSGARKTAGRGYAFGEFFFDVEGHSLLREGEEIALRPRSFRVLHHLLENHGRLVTRDQLMGAVWGNTVVTEGSLTQCIIDIRRAIGDTDMQMIRTVPREGYVFDAPVTEARYEAPASVAVARRRPMLPAVLAVTTITGVAILLAWRLSDHRAEPADQMRVPPAKSIAVLPFADMSPDGDRQYFADGLSEEILNRLAQTRELRVIARTSSFSLRDRNDIDAIAMGRLLNVSYLLEGSVRHSGDRLRVTAQLIETAGGTHLWSQSYDGGPGDTLGVQDQVADSVAAAMRVALEVPDGAGSPRQPLAAAFDAYARGRFLHARREPGDLHRAKELYLEAISLDPRYAQPWAGLAGLHLLELGDHEKDYDTVLQDLGNAARTAISLDPALADAHARLSQFHFYSGDQELAVRHLERAQELNPNSPLVIGLQAGRSALQGRYADALALQRRAIELDPLSFVSRFNMVGFLMFAGRYDEAEAELVELDALRVENADIPTRRFQIYLLQGRLDDARAVIEGVPTASRKQQSKALLNAATGDLTESDAAMQGLREQETPEAALLLAEVYSYRGEYDSALRWLKTSYRRLGPTPTASAITSWHTEARLSPFLQELRNEPGAEPYLVAKL